ncbi:MAG TPA: hypothetical protein VEA99_12445, partial [Gemmatimonadaceae bacterium]|nr:hypothetical protein [Gemmatimonadaceae bacterium]
RDGSLRWDDAVRGAAIAAVDELKILLRAAREWGEEETRRAGVRTKELTAFVPVSRGTATPATPSAASSVGFLAGEMANIAAGLELVLTRPEDSGSATMVLRRVRALRGVAAVKDLPPLVAQVLEAAEQAAQPLEVGERTVAPAQRELIGTASEVLRAVADAMRAGRAAEVREPLARRFGDALDTWLDSATESERVVPIASLFHDDRGPHLVSASASPPTTASARFRLELVSQGEHLMRVTEEAQGAHDDAARERYRRELRRALRGVRALAESFEEQEVVGLSDSFLSAGAFDAATLERIRRMAALLADPSLDRETLDARLHAIIAPTPASADAPPAVEQPPAVTAPAPTASPAPVAAPPVTVPPAARVAPEPAVEPAVSAPAPEPSRPVATSSLLERGLAGLARLDASPLGIPVPMAEQPPVVPIETLVYRGRSAVRRAIELRDEMRRGGSTPTREVVEELFDLMELALLDEAVA